jgi:hypothetical protein
MRGGDRLRGKRALGQSRLVTNNSRSSTVAEPLESCRSLGGGGGVILEGMVTGVREGVSEDASQSGAILFVFFDGEDRCWLET